MVGNIEIVTPNHGLILDTFIMYGFIRAISEGEGGSDRLERTVVKPEGEYYSIEVSEEDIQEIEVRFYDSLYEAFKSDVSLARSGRSWRLGALFQNEEKTLDDLENFLEGLREASRDILKIFDLFRATSTWEEWRSYRCGLHIKILKRSLKVKSLVKDYTVQISLSPQLGKYLYNYDEGVYPRQQKVCPLCASLSILGLLSHSVRMVLREGGKTSGWQFVVMIPTTNVLAQKISLFREAFGKTGKLIMPLSLNKMPEVMTPLLLFKGMETSSLKDLLQTKPTLFAYRFEPSPGKPGVMAVRKTSEYPASRFIEFYLKVRERASNVDMKLLNYMEKDRYFPFFSELALSIMTRDPERFYKFLRGLSAEIIKEEKGKERAFFSEAFVKQALRFYGKRR
ncbi:MAG: hypothetical protein QXK52_01670 [Candidatus Bathyarchaeia archaeon]